jgi:hypothetical protein
MLMPCYRTVKIIPQDIQIGRRFRLSPAHASRDNQNILNATENFMTPDSPVRVWLVPQKFWAATRNMQPEQADSLLQRVSDLAARNQIDALHQFDFIIVGNLKDKRFGPS